MEEEGIEQQILLQPEFAVVGAVYSVNGYTGHVVLKTSDLENDSGYQTASDIDSAINEHNEDEFAHPYLQTLIGTKQDELTPGVNINISSDNVISATDTTYSAGNGININGENAISVDTTVVATQQNLANEVTNRENADNALQAQIDGISASSDVVDIVGTYAELQQYDTQHLKDNDIIKVLQDETQGGATTYYRWSTSTSTFTLIGQEGPYYTKAAADSQFVPQTRTVNGKALSSNITLNASDVSALGTSDIVQTTGSSTSQVMSQNAVTTQLNTKLNASDYVVDTQLADSSNPVQNRVINNLLGNMPADFFTAGETVSGEGTDITLNNTISAPLKSVELDGDTYQQTYSGKNYVNQNNTTYTYTNATSAGITISVETLPTGLRFTASATSSLQTVFALFKSIDLNNYVGKTVRAKANITENGRIRLGLMNAGATTRVAKVATSTSGEEISFVVEQSDLENTPYLYYDVAVLNTSTSPRTVDFTDYIVTIDNADMTYEPYTGGGTPSPNPDYPQDVQVVTGSQNVWVHGKNLMNIPNFDYTQSGIRGVCTNGVIEFTGTAGNTYYPDFRFCADGNVFTRAYRSTASSINVSRGFFTKPNTEYKLSIFVEGNTPYSITEGFETKVTNNLALTGSQTFTINDSERLNFVSISFSQNTTTNIKVRIQLELGSTATTYEPYQGNNYTVDLGSIELCKIGTYQDYIYKSGGDWYVHKACGNVVLDGSDDEGWTVASYDRVRTSSIFGLLYNSGSSYGYYANQLTNANSETVDNSFNIGASAIFLKCTSKTSSVANWKTWLSSNNLIIYAPLATATDTKITDSTLVGQLEALRNAKTNLGTTSFLATATGTNLPVILDIVAYRKSLAGMLGAIERLSE